ncbi:hypothetical protein HYC85_016855 [Camellia sinensis]|uniref:Uncharacterized protein n=1 Tax=Camellia sinensis TaxID=4442 RepID=A0A7J7H210_CAMSI|nr:hypothetical protein HYC85_016855 [Camellia sinensis]
MTIRGYPQLTNVDRGAKHEVPDLSGGYDQKVLFDWVHSMDSFICWWYQLTIRGNTYY